jgi:hypothetical protein
MALNHNIFNVRTYTIGLVIIIIVLGLLIFRECTPKHNDSGLKLITEQYNQVKREGDSIKTELTRRENERDSLEKHMAGLKDDLYLYQRQNIKYAGDVNSLSRKLDQARKDKDTVSYVQSCDSLQHVAEDQQGVIYNQQLTTQAIIDNFDERLEKVDSSNAALIGLNNKLQTGYDFAMQEAKKQNEIARQNNKQLRKEKTKTRVLAGAVLATIVYFIIPK